MVIPHSWISSGPATTPEEEMFATLDAAQIPARALSAADDILVPLFDDPRVRLSIRTAGERTLSMQEATLIRRTFAGAFEAQMGYPQWQADTFTRQMQSHKFVGRGTDETAAFSNLALRYARLKYSSQVRVGHATMNGKIEACIVAISCIPRGTVILELGGIMSSDTVENPGLPSARAQGHTNGHKSKLATFESFALIWRGKGQTGPGPKKDRLLLGPARFVNHSCTPNCKLRPFPKANAWGIEAAKDLLPDDEITIDYGDQYFASGECACAHCKTKRAITTFAPSPAPPPVSLYVLVENVEHQEKSNKRRRLESEQDVIVPRPKKKRSSDKSVYLV